MKKFIDMTTEEKLELIEAKRIGRKVDACASGIDKWDDTGSLVININLYYHIQKRPMSIDWSVLNDEFICAARDINGSAYAFKSEVVMQNRAFWACLDHSVDISALSSYDPGTVDWKDSLIYRPGYEPKEDV